MGEPKKEASVPLEELMGTDTKFVLSMDSSTRQDWFQMALMQAATGKLKAAALFDSVRDPQFATSKQLKASLMANLHLFSSKQQKVIQESVKNAIVSSGGGR